MQKKFAVYAIKSLNKNYIYVGQTSKLSERISRHNNGKERTTKPYKPFKLIYQEWHNDRISARKREKYFKSGVGKEFLKSINIMGEWRNGRRDGLKIH